MNDKKYELHAELVGISQKVIDLAKFIRENGTEVNYEVQFVGGSYPVDTPHTSAGHLAQELQNSLVALFGSSRWVDLLIGVENAESRYEEEYNDAKRELDIR